MTTGDYTTTGGGLKLKGGIEKPKKKKNKNKRVSQPGPSAATALVSAIQGADQPDLPRGDAAAVESGEAETRGVDADGADGAGLQSALAQEDEALGNGGAPREAYVKTEAELRHEERRRRQFHERLKREGVKTHKERVEVLNTYLSRLSEHHDMPRIGPG